MKEFKRDDEREWVPQNQESNGYMRGAEKDTNSDTANQLLD